MKKEIKKQYTVWAGEGEVLRKVGAYATLRGAKRVATIESCYGDRHAVVCDIRMDYPSEAIYRAA